MGKRTVIKQTGTPDDGGWRETRTMTAEETIELLQMKLSDRIAEIDALTMRILELEDPRGALSVLAPYAEVADCRQAIIALSYAVEEYIEGTCPDCDQSFWIYRPPMGLGS